MKRIFGLSCRFEINFAWPCYILCKQLASEFFYNFRFDLDAGNFALQTFLTLESAVYIFVNFLNPKAGVFESVERSDSSEPTL